MHIWSSLTSDSFILKYVSGECLDFTDLPLQVAPPRPLSFKPSEQIALDLAVNKFLCHGIVEPCEPSSGLCFYSNIFPVLKKDGSARIILNLSDLNVHVEHIHFKMETLKDVIPVVFHKCFFATIDLQDAYYSVPIRPADRDWLRFLWHGKHYRFTCLPQGFTSAPRIFTRLLKPVFALFRKFGLITTCYIDDCIFIAASRDELMDQLRFALQVFDSLGLTVNVGKSSLTPSQKVEFLGFIIDSVNMSISITSQKQVKIKKLGAQLLLRDRISIRELSSFIGNVVASEPAVLSAPLKIRYLEAIRNKALVFNRGDYDGPLVLDSRARDMITWWVNFAFPPKPLSSAPVRLLMFTDASNTGWGATLGDHTAGGHWSLDELSHINVLELKAVLLGLQALGKDLYDVHILIHIDNTTAVACIDRCGSTKIPLLNLTEEIFSWAYSHRITLSAIHIKGCDNVKADRLSRNVDCSSEWALRSHVFNDLCAVFGTPRADIFATRINAQLPSYVSWKPDPGACAVNAFSISWANGLLYAFPPFSVVGRVLQKLVEEQATLVLVIPIWPSRTWFSRALQLLVEVPRILPKDCLVLPQDPSRTHPLADRMRLAAMVLSGDVLRIRAFRQMLQPFSSPLGDPTHCANMATISSDGCYFVSKRKLILFDHL